MYNFYIHIGNFKTGSTSLQSFLYLNRKIFLKKNIEILYEKKSFIKDAPQNEKMFKYINNLNEIKIKNFLTKLNKKKNYIMSSEYFSTLTGDTNKLKFLKDIIIKSGFKPIIIFYYRNDKTYLYSFYRELLKHKKIIRIDTVFNFLKKIEKYGYYRNIKNNYYFFSQNYYFDNQRIFYEWTKIFKKNFYKFEYDKKKRK